MTLILVFVGAGIVGAMIGWILSAIIFAGRDPADQPKWPVTAGMIICLVIALPLASRIGAPDLDAVMRDLERHEPVYALLRQKEPAAYDRLRSILDMTIRSGRLESDQASRLGGEVWGDVVARRSLSANDSQIDLLLDLVIDQTAALEPHPQVCADLLAGRAGDMRPFLTEPLQQREIDLYRSLLSTSPQHGFAMPMPEAEEMMTRLLPAMAQDVGVPVQAFASLLEGQGDPATICRAGRIFLEHIRRVDDGRRGQLYRRLLLEGQTGAAAPGS